MATDSLIRVLVPVIDIFLDFRFLINYLLGNFMYR